MTRIFSPSSGGSSTPTRLSLDKQDIVKCDARPVHLCDQASVHHNFRKSAHPPDCDVVEVSASEARPPPHINHDAINPSEASHFIVGVRGVKPKEIQAPATFQGNFTGATQNIIGATTAIDMI